MAAKFYKRVTPTKAVFPNAVYTDLYDNNKITTDIQSGNVGGIENSTFIISDFILPEKPPFGNAELAGAKIGLFINNITQGGISGTAGLKAFKLGVGIGGNEGGKTTAGTLIDNQDIVQICSYHDEDAGYIEELFTHNKDEEDLEIIEQTLLKRVGPYLTESVGYEKGQNWGKLQGVIPDFNTPITAETHKKRFGQKQDDGSGEGTYIYKIEKERQGWGQISGWKSIKKHGSWWRRNEEWWKGGRAQLSHGGVGNDVKYMMEVTVEIPPEDRPLELNTENSFFDAVKQTTTFRTVTDDSNTLKREAYCHLIYGTTKVRTGGGTMGLSSLFTHRNNAETNAQYSLFSNPTKLVDGLPVSTEIPHSALQQVAFATKTIPTAIDVGNSQVAKRAAAGTHAAIPTVELDMYFEHLAPMLVRDERVDKDDDTSDPTWRLNRSVVVTFGELKPENTDNLYSYTKRHLPDCGRPGRKADLTNGSGEPYMAWVGITCTEGDAVTSGQFEEKEYMKLISADGTERVYVITDSNGEGETTGTVMIEDSDTGDGKISEAEVTFWGCPIIAVQADLTSVSQANMLNEFRDAIQHANGHNGRIIAGAARWDADATVLPIVPANGPQTLHLTQNAGGTAGNTNIQEDMADCLDSGNIGNFRGGLNTYSFFGHAFFNYGGELCSKAMEKTSSGGHPYTDLSFTADDDLGEITFRSEPDAIEGGLNVWTRLAYQFHPDSQGVTACMYEAESGDVLLNPNFIRNCSREKILTTVTSGVEGGGTNFEYMASSSAANSESNYSAVDRHLTNRNKVSNARYMTIWLNNYPAVRGQWNSTIKGWKSGLKLAAAVSTDSDLTLKIDDPSTGERAEGGWVKSHSWELIVPKTSIRAQVDDSNVTEAIGVATKSSTPSADGDLVMTTSDDKDMMSDGYLFYDNNKLVDSEVGKGNEDMETEVHIDAIRFKKFNAIHQNATPSANNTFPKRLTIPSPKNLIPFNFTLNLNNTPDNVYDGKAYQPSYISFGFDNWYDMMGTSADGILTADTKKLLVNDFVMAINSISDTVIINTNDSKHSHVRAGYTAHEDYGIQCRNVMLQSGEGTMGTADLGAGYHSAITNSERNAMNLHSDFFESGVLETPGTPTYNRRGLIVGGATGTVGTDHELSIGANADGQIDSFTHKGILEWNFNSRKTAAQLLVSTVSSVTDSTTATVAYVGSGNGANHTVSHHILIDTEIMKVTAINNDILTVERGAYGTTAATHTGTPLIYHIAVPIKRENVFCSARILDVDINVIKVDDTSILKLKDGEEFIIYKYGDSHESPTYTPRIVKVVRIIDDVEAVLDLDPALQGVERGDYLISPYRYWLTMEIMSVGGEVTKTVTDDSDPDALILADTDGLKKFFNIKDTSTTITSIDAATGTVNLSADVSTPVSTVTFTPSSWQGNNSSIVRKYLPERSFQNVVGITEKGTYGTTLNESLYNDGANINSWSLEAFEDSKESVVILNDYGLGAFDKDSESGGHAGFLPLNIQGDTGKYKELDVSGVISKDNPEFGDTLTFIMSTDDPAENFKINVDTEAGTNPIYMLAALEDELMEAPILKLQPNKENAFYPDFTWDSSDKDSWYGFLIISDENIYNQYHSAVIHYPFNESGSHGTAASAPIENISGITTTIAGPLYNVEGLAGYALDFDGDNDYVECNTAGPNYTTNGSDPTSSCTTEMSVVAHIVPDNASDNRYIIAQHVYSGESISHDKFYLRLNSSNQIEARVAFDTGTDDGVLLTSSSIIPADGEIPTNIILTVDTTLKSGNVKLFINGKLEDQTGLRTTAGSTNNWKTGQSINGGNGTVRIGGHVLYDDSSFDGKLEEMVIYKKCIYPVVPLDGTYKYTKASSELVANQSIAQPKSNTAKIFIKDYHNIRGKTNDDVATSSQISWRKASFALDTT